MILNNTYKALLILTALTSLIPACSNDVDILAPSKDIPIVYCILNQNDSQHFVRIERSFAGAKNAYDMAQEHDSIYYTDAEVYIEEWNNNSLISSIPFSLNFNVQKDSGIFSYHSNPIFSAKATLNGSSDYKLNIKLPNTDNLITAQTHLVDSIRIIKPEFTRPTLAFSAYHNYLEVQWISSPFARIYFLQIRFNYLDVFGLDTIAKSKIWNISHFISDHAQGGEKMETKIIHEKFYQWVNSHFPLPDKGEKRIATKKAIDLLFTVGGEELFTYIDLTNPRTNTLTERPAYSNISNGIGLFSARYEQEIQGKALTYPSIDSLSYGQLTKG
ncbi:MAG: DUF4249 family protein, partial [Bacteroidales bacterium]|nr:DUF4249 family protein [Bacteroidales bacterium]